MTNRYEPYPQYKPSGVEWLGDVPEHWDVQRIGALMQQRHESNTGPKTENILSVMKDIGVIPYDEKGDVGNKKSEDIERYQVVHVGDLVVNSMNVIIGSVGISRYYGALSPVYHVLYPPKNSGISPEFVGWAFSIQTFQCSLKRLGYGILDHRLRIPMDNLKLENLPVPSLPEQRAIASFLDRETGKIDRLIAKQERMIKLLKEKRQAVISHAVTKGLDPNVPMKDSGIEWLSEIPEHWTVGNIRRFAEMETGHTPSRSKPEYWKDCTIPWFTLSDVWQLRDGKRIYLEETKEKVSKVGLANSAAVLLPKGTVVFSRTASVGFSGIMPVDMATSQDFWNWVCRSKLKPEFLLYLFRAMKQEFAAVRMGSTHKTIYQPIAAALSICVPSIEEQTDIIEHIEQQTGNFDNLIAKAEQAINLMKERRTALISAAVTGKIDVRGEA